MFSLSQYSLKILCDLLECYVTKFSIRIIYLYNDNELTLICYFAIAHNILFLLIVDNINAKHLSYYPDCSVTLSPLPG